ncbi:MAG: Uncharacterized protein G01um101448_285 [Parcubacteria group bacterium Gr01-1014_48]|nr:MAG: Uncharacterized protein Greene041614_603 [Parcubacteria group bacterium Greene0416_14]TSC74175.1 MAG: Uncharacterized protein G01um101448_285 [Parcubacteria group bacterium Gr01-1014_48]TSD00851.1 MAG: Uncharacterized protein Greene101415_652 [Parcubacteria group bacterium Greene1014_15]TSD07933.1 MAG: Uncharacterized protein Greene07144_563 [Parcubacteria group bacterium Greene0714_4]
MEFIKNLHLESVSMPKKIALLAVLILIVAVVLSVIKMVLSNTFGISQGGFGSSIVPSFSYDAYREDYDRSYGVAEGAPNYNATKSLGSSFVPSAMPLPPIPPYPQDVTPGNDAEDFEITSYDALIQANGESSDECASILALKSREDIVFENSTESKTGCSYTFKVENATASEVLAIIKSLNPKSLDENTYTIKRTITGLMSEIDILTKKLASIEATLEQALNAYDEISRIATADKDAESLAKIIDSKVNLIERLSVERINIQNQITTIQRSYSDQLDHLNYTVFTVSVFEQKVVDFEQIGDSWIAELRTFFAGLNTTLQQMTIGILSFLINFAYYALIFVIMLYVAKYGWRMTKTFWNS